MRRRDKKIFNEIVVLRRRPEATLSAAALP
jgi:hypothetical protein